MRRILTLIMLAGMGSGGFYFNKYFDWKVADGGVTIKPKSNVIGSIFGGSSSADDSNWNGPPIAPLPDARRTDAIRIASFNIQVFGESKIAKPNVMRILADIVRQFDVVAIQEIRAKSPDIIPKFVQLINSEGRHYDFVIGERQGRTDSKEQYAYLYDAQTIEVDRGAVYSIRDPDSLLHRPPLVASFRVRGPPPQQAFTFTLVNVHTDPDDVANEMSVLDDVYRNVRNDGRREDDIIMLGDFNANERKFGQVGQIPDILWVISGIPTNTHGTELYDNIFFQRRATVEFTGMGGVVDLMSRYNISQEQAIEVSDHMPIWAEFSVYEGGQGNRIATQPGVNGR